MDFLSDHAMLYIYLASAFTLTWYKPLKYTLQAESSEYHNWITYWVVLGVILNLEHLLYPSFSENLGYYFFRTLLMFYISERKFLALTVDQSSDYNERTMKRIGNITSVKLLCSLLDNEEEVSNNGNLHPWAPTPTSINALAVCRIGELCSLSQINEEDENFLSENGLEVIVRFLEDPEDSKSVNSLLCLLFLSEKKVIKNKLVCLEVMPRIKRFVEDRSKQVSQTALRLCRNIYYLNNELQQDFIKLGYGKRLLDCLKEHDPLVVLEALDNIFTLILTPQGDAFIPHLKALISEGLLIALPSAEHNHGAREEIRVRLQTIREICGKITHS